MKNKKAIMLGNATPRGIGFTPLQKCFNLPMALKHMLKAVYFWTISNRLYTDYFIESNYTQLGNSTPLGSELPQINRSRNQARCHS